ncbi:hypothetical protein GCM10007207_27920 [Asaia siamensis]|uniref:Uncharacterized protein n=1 Tax=Asaia siamensis TaxID=110479 RepID=A0ABQ1MHR9_9PROT|nr:hypothetical protein GCM10007207_27920 [Asaia siamensis]
MLKSQSHYDTLKKGFVIGIVGADCLYNRNLTRGNLTCPTFLRRRKYQNNNKRVESNNSTGTQYCGLMTEN